MQQKILITRKLPTSIYEKLANHFAVTMWEQEDTPIPREVLLKRIKEVDGIFCLITETIDREVMEAAPNLKVISNMAVGYNNIDVEEASKRNIVVTNTPGVLTETTADLTLALMMATARRLMYANDCLHHGKWKTWSPFQFTGKDIYGATLGIIGFGRIGQAVAKRATGFDMNILYYNRSRKWEEEKALGVSYVDLNRLLQQSDYVCLLVPYNEETHHLIGSHELNLMKDSAVLINTARGGIVDEKALYKALKNNQLWGAGLDVFANEPVNPEHPLLSLPNVVALPHIGSASLATRMKMAHLAADNLLNALQAKGSVKRVN